MSKNIRTEIVINVSKEKVWSILTNFSDYPKWNPFIISIEGELGVGLRLKNTMLNGEKKFVFKPIILTVTPNKYFDWLGSLLFKGIFDGHHSFEIEEIAPDQVRLIHGEHFSGLLVNMILNNKLEAETRNNFIKMNEAVKALAEQRR
jgi:hypothetical protein